MAAIDNQDQGVEVEVEGTRITVYTLLPHFLNSTTTEADICRLYDLHPEQVAAARAYILNNADSVLSRHLEIENERTAGNPPHVIERANKTHATLLRFREWLTQQKEAESTQQSSESQRPSGRTGAEGFLTFKEWLAERESRPGAGS